MTRRELAIQEGVLIPIQQRQARSVGGETARKMKVNDSVFTTVASEAETIRCTLYELGGKAASRKRLEDGAWGWRIWRTK